MPDRVPSLKAIVCAALLALPLLAGSALQTRAQEGPEARQPLSAADSLGSPLGAARYSYQQASQQLRDGDPASALRTIETASNGIQAALDARPDLKSALALKELQGRFVGLYDRARSGLQAVQTQPGNEADESVLNASAIDSYGTIEPQDHELVTRWIDFFVGAGRSTFERWLKRSGRYMELFRSVLQREGLPPDLVNLVFVESGFNMNARSVSAAVGPWQFLRSTGKFFGLTVNSWVDERKDPEKATVAAARYLKHLYSIFGDWPLALASYNAGEGTVLRAIKAQGTTNYWDLKLPRQTEDYVPQFMAALTISRDPARFGFDPSEFDDPMDFQTVALRGPVDLRAIARLTGCSLEELKTLNPAVLHTAARGPEGITTLRLPPGKDSVLVQRLQSGAQLPAVNLTLRHKVRRGETLQRIASEYSVGAKDLARINGIGRKHPLRRGMVLTVPSSLRAPTPVVLDRQSDPRANSDYVPVRRIGLPASLAGRSSTEGRTVVMVKRGETLAGIAAREGVSTQDLMRWNRLKSARVSPGTRLKVRTPDAIAADSSSVNDSLQIATLKAPKPRGSKHHAAAAKPAHGRGATARVSHTVRGGETLSDIARQHGVSVSALKRANGISGTRIKAGQRLKLPNG
jgi:membrane-bound lytic murein transglycosylase D